MALVEWNDVDTVLLDMDGTLLDRHFDDYFWEEYVPLQYAAAHHMEVDAARRHLLSLYREREGTLDWTDLDYWSRRIGLDIPVLKARIDHLIQVHPFVVEFLTTMRLMGKTVALVTNAHFKTLHLKMDRTALADHFDTVICAAQVGVAKEDPAFWPRLTAFISYEPERTMLADDNEAVLDSAAQSGIRHLIFVARPSSTLPVRPSSRYPSITFFRELLAP